MNIHHEDDRVQLWHGDAVEVLASLPDASVDSVVCDPPYNLSFMGREWDSHVSAVAFQQWCETWATECLRVLKPGGHLLAFGGTRTWHRLACAIEDAGFDIRDSIAWLYGSGFPKSLDVSKAIDKMDATDERRARALRFTAWMRTTGITSRQVDEATGTSMGGHYLTAESQPAVATVAHLDALRPLLPEVPEWVEAMARQRTVESQTFASREVVGSSSVPIGHAFAGSTYGGDSSGRVVDLTAPATPAAERWQGWGTALKPSFEPVVVARKPLGGPVSIRSRVEYELRQRGVEGEIQWATRPASDADSQSPTPTSGSTSQQPTAATSARNASASATPSTESATASDTATSTASGEPQTPTRSRPTAETPTGDSATPSSTPTAPTASAVAKQSRRSSRSTTSTEAAPSTESQSTERSTPNSAAKDSPTATGSFAGIATGLSGSWATVRIDRLADGTFVWPDGLPEMVTAGSTVAANVLAHGTGALNIDGCRVGTNGERIATPQSNPDNRDPSSYAVLSDRERFQQMQRDSIERTNTLGRWPANVLLDDNQAAELDRQSGDKPPSTRTAKGGACEKPGHLDGHLRGVGSQVGDTWGYEDRGGASRFFKVFSQTPSDLVFLPVECETWQPPGDASTRAESTSAGRSTESRYASSPTGGYGSKQTDPSPTATRSTTGTTTPSTTTSTTSCASPPSGTTTTTSDSASSTDGSTVSRSAAASGATPTSPSTPSPSDGLAPSKATAESAPRHTAESGSPETATSSTHDDARSEHAASTPDFPTFRYQAKAPTKERPFYTAEDGSRVAHPTTKPLTLMSWLVRLVTPPGGTVLEPFAGSGTTVEAAIVEGFHCIAIEREADYLPLIMQRINRRLDPVAAIKQTGDDLGLFDLEGEGA